MNKSELVSRLAERLGGDRTVAAAAVAGVLEEIESSVARGERVSLIGFGTFERRERAARTGRNPQTGATIQLGASAAPVFRPGAGFRSLVTQNGGAAKQAVEPEAQEVEAGVGDTDPVQAIEDALREFPADEVIVVTRPGDEASWLEAGAGEEAKRRFRVPVTHLVTD